MRDRKVIAFEGIDGSGKTVQFSLLKKYLQDNGYVVACKEFPVYSSFFGGIVGKLLSGEMSVNASTLDPMSMALWFAMDRVCGFEEMSNDYDILLLNRYVLSNAVYQSIRCNEKTDKTPHEMIDWVYELEHDRLHLPRPDMYIFFDVSETQADENVRNKGFRDYVGNDKDVYEKSDGMQTNARERYLECARRFDNIKVIDCMHDGKFLPAEQISGIVIDVLKQNNIID